MYPFFLESLIGDKILIPTYGLFLAIAFTLCYIDSLRRAMKAGLEPKHIENLFLIIVLTSVFGSRAFHVLFENFSYFQEHPIEVFYFWQGGFTFYGALIAATVGSVLYAVLRKISVPQYSDIACTSAALGLFIGRIGCFMAGCCWGKPTDLPWGVVFDHPRSFASPLHVPLHPTQLYESLLSLALYVYLLWLGNRKRYEGQLTVHAMLFYPVARIVVEVFRGDAYRGFVGYLSTSQFISLWVIAAGVYLRFLWSSKTRKQKA